VYNWTGAFRQSRPAAARLDADSSTIDGEAAVRAPTGCHGSRSHRGEGGKEGHRRLFFADQGVDPM
jgi:hypothetical protein